MEIVITVCLWTAGISVYLGFCFCIAQLYFAHKENDVCWERSVVLTFICLIVLMLSGGLAAFLKAVTVGL